MHEVVDHLFRQQAGRMVAILARIFGPGRLELAEDVVQEALVTALRKWPFIGIPEDPAAWIVRAARNRALDRLRRDQALAGKWPEVQRAFRASAPAPDATFSRELDDDTLRLMVTCCRPEVPHDSRVALTLKLVGGFGVAEIARAFLLTEATVAQRLVRAKRKLREAGAEMEMPAPAQLPDRLTSLLETLYLMFNEGHSAHRGEALVRRDLCQEAIRLAGLLARHPATAEARVDALAALFCLQAARLPARVGPDGEARLLAEQDRTLWDAELLARGLAHLEQSARGEALSSYHLEAEIAACHTTAPSWEQTDWERIVDLYDRLLAGSGSPVVGLNRAVALAEARGPEEGLTALAAIETHPSMAGYFPFHATRAVLLERSGRPEAENAHRQALALAGTAPLRRLARRRLEAFLKSEQGGGASKDAQPTPLSS